MLLKVISHKESTTPFALFTQQIIQGAADDPIIREYYQSINNSENHILILNCARRFGEDTICPVENTENIIYWLPMTETNAQTKSKEYIQKFLSTWTQKLHDGFTIVINCSEGLIRSKILKDNLIKKLTTTK